MKRFILYLSILFIGLAQLTNAQNITVSLPDTIVTVGAKSLDIPLLVQNFNNIGAISLKINYNPSVLKYNGITNTPVSGFFANADTTSGVIAIGWYSSDGKTPLNVGNGKLLDLIFDFTSGSSPLSFVKSQSQISDINNVSQTVTFTDGSVSSPVRVSLDNVKASPGDTVIVPLRGFNLTNVGAISLKIQYDPSVLSFIKIQDDSVGFTSNDANGILSLAWYSNNNVAYNILQGIMAKIVFKYINNSTPLTFFKINDQTVISDINNNVINVQYIGGSVSKDVSMSLPNLNAYVNTDVDFPLTIKNMSVGSASLKIQFDPSVLTYKNIVDSTNGIVSANAQNGILTIGYANTTPPFVSGKLLDIIFTYVGGTSNLTFLQNQSEVTDEKGSIYSGFTYNDGSISLNVANRPPVFINVLPDTTIKENQNLTYTYSAQDPDGDTVTYALIKGATGASIGSKTGVFSWTPTYSQAGSYTIVVSASDGKLSVNDTAKITVLNVNRKPYFTKFLSSDSLGRTDTLIFQYAAADSDGQTLKYLLINPPANTVINPSTGLMRFIAPDQETSVTITVGVTDGIDTTTTSAKLQIITGIKPVEGPPKDFSLSQNYPNPFNPSTNIDFSIQKESRVVLKIYNLLGQVVATLINKDMSAGKYKYEFNANNLSSGIYIYRLQAGNYTFTKKMTLLK